MKSLDIDHGELDGLTPEECFILGFEFAVIGEWLKDPGPIIRPIHTHNRDRIEKLCRKGKRSYKITFMHEDKSESWLQLEVAAR